MKFRVFRTSGMFGGLSAMAPCEGAQRVEESRDIDDYGEPDAPVYQWTIEIESLDDLRRLIVSTARTKTSARVVVHADEDEPIPGIEIYDTYRE